MGMMTTAVAGEELWMLYDRRREAAALSADAESAVTSLRLRTPSHWRSPSREKYELDRDAVRGAFQVIADRLDRVLGGLDRAIAEREARADG